MGMNWLAYRLHQVSHPFPASPTAHIDSTVFNSLRFYCSSVRVLVHLRDLARYAKDFQDLEMPNTSV